jgi:hypothetical protein
VGSAVGVYAGNAKPTNVYVRYKLAGVALAALGTYGLWLGLLRTLPLFQVENVTVTGLSGNAAPQISSTITLTAREMTTTDFSASRLRQAVSGYNAVATVNVHTHFPHGVVVQVVERQPIARLAAGGNMLAVSADGRVLAGLVPSHGPLRVRSSATRDAGRRGASPGRSPVRASSPCARRTDAPAPLRARAAAVTPRRTSASDRSTCAAGRSSDLRRLRCWCTRSGTPAAAVLANPLLARRAATSTSDGAVAAGRGRSPIQATSDAAAASHRGGPARPRAPARSRACFRLPGSDPQAPLQAE